MDKRTEEKYEDLKEEKINQRLNRRKSNIMRIIFEKNLNQTRNSNEKHKDRIEIEESESGIILGHDNIISLNKAEEQNIRDKSFDINQNKKDINTSNIINNNPSGENIGDLSNNLYEKNLNQRITLINKNPKTEIVNTEQTVK